MIRDKIAFYLYDYTNVLPKKNKKIYSPYNVKTLWRIASEDTFRDPDFVEFIKWVYILDVNKVWEKRYDEQLEWLNFYNTTWGLLRKWKWDAEYLNWRKYRNDWIHIIKTEKIQTWPVTTIKKVIEKTNIQQIPLAVAEAMNIPQLKQLAASWNVILPEDLMEKGKATDITEIIIWLLKENGNIAD